MIKKILFLLLLPVTVFAHGGEDHAGEKKAVVGDASYFSSEASSDKYELLIKYQTIPVGKESTFKLFITEYVTNKPVDPDELSVSVSGNADLKFTMHKIDSGVYEIKGIFPEKKKYNISVSLNGKLGADLLLVKDIETGKEIAKVEVTEVHAHWYNSNLFYGILGALGGMLVMFLLLKKRNKRITTISIIFLLLFPASSNYFTSAHEGEEHGDKKTANTGGPSNTFIVEKESQFLFDILTQKVETGNFNQSTEVLGTIVPSPKGKAVIQTPQTGKIVSIRTTVGQRVSAGQVLAVIEQQVDAGTQISIISQKNTVESEYNAAKAQYNRLSGIADIVAKKDLTEAKARFETAAKNKRLFEANAKGNLNSTKMVTLTAPISGVVGTFNYSIGAVISAGQTLFEITNLDRVFVEAQVFSHDVIKLRTLQKVTAYSSLPNDTTEYNVNVISTAQQVNPENQSQVVLFEVTNANGRFKIGENINIRIYSSNFTRQIIIPDAAIADVNGKPAVFIKDKAEQYSISYVNKGTSNGKAVNIIKGVEEGERVVTNGVYQMKTMFLNQ
ncbi:MAG TPA: efflux RND transporter periplasmic adaptor subunit [Chitinophagaceae bacterium]|nr:efflux RND transporter periplasmic adaptor subunit [Chitinophagaceae bacterium]